MQLLDLDIRTLQTFQTLVEHGTMAKAAHHLEMTQPAVSYTIQRLEKQLDTVLFDRRMRPMRPTAAGNLLYQHSQKLTRDADHIVSLVKSLDSPTVPQLRIGLIDSYSIAIGPKLISSLQQQVRQLSLWSGISPGLETDLLQRNLDFIVCPNPLSELPDLESTILYREPYVFVTSRKYAGRPADTLFTELLQNHPLIRYSQRSRIGTQIANHLRWMGMNVREGMEFDGSEAVLSMVAEDLGWAITTPLCLLHARGYQDVLVSFPLPEPKLRRSLYLINHSGAFPGFRDSFIRSSSRIFRQQYRQHFSMQHGWMVKQTELFQGARNSES
jgi:DNA-binding transcriptional LysR family regulator